MSNSIVIAFETATHDVFTLTAIDTHGEIVEKESFYFDREGGE
jgi:hypothetical protein|tara:strand:+ start:915 stop:1043 length:129 start_codon:yes stop_codon:yes gene_type:complete